MRIFFQRCVLSVIAVLYSTAASASLCDEIFDKWKNDGKYDEYVQDALIEGNIPNLRNHDEKGYRTESNNLDLQWILKECFEANDGTAPEPAEIPTFSNDLHGPHACVGIRSGPGEYFEAGYREGSYICSGRLSAQDPRLLPPKTSLIAQSSAEGCMYDHLPMDRIETTFQGMRATVDGVSGTVARAIDTIDRNFDSTYGAHLDEYDFPYHPEIAQAQDRSKRMVEGLNYFRDQILEVQKEIEVLTSFRGAFTQYEIKKGKALPVFGFSFATMRASLALWRQPVYRSREYGNPTVDRSALGGFDMVGNIAIPRKHVLYRKIKIEGKDAFVVHYADQSIHSIIISGMAAPMPGLESTYGYGLCLDRRGMEQGDVPELFKVLEGNIRTQGKRNLKGI